ncbi:MAG TPA: hypothetical protein VG407_10480 [Caulobacteraceae bacterium]|nr:hypothetical protein [Caulobacteraceae bacterium]
MQEWRAGQGLLGPLRPLMGAWVHESQGGTGAQAMRCSRMFRPFGKDWIQLDACWDQGEGGQYRETAFIGAAATDADKGLRIFSFTNDGKKSEGRLSDGADIHPDAIAFESQMPAGLARAIYWPLEDGAPGFWFAVESRSPAGWNRFLIQRFTPDPAHD